MISHTASISSHSPTMLRAHSPLGIPFALSLVFPHSLNGNLAWWVANACESHHILEFGTYIELALCFSLLPALSSHNGQASDHESVKFFFSRHSSPALYHSHSFILSFKYGVLFSLNITSLSVSINTCSFSTPSGAIALYHCSQSTLPTLESTRP